MTGTRIAIETLTQAQEASVANLHEAIALEAEAASLREGAPVKVDNAIESATIELIAETKNGTLSPRESYEATVDILQFTPSRTVVSPVDKQRALDAFDQLTEGAPFLIDDRYHTRGYAGVSMPGIPSVKISVKPGRGPLPDADISFFARVAVQIEDGARLERRRKKTLSLAHDLGHSAVGVTQINELIASQEVVFKTCGCGRRHSPNADEIHALITNAQLLAQVTDIELVIPSRLREQVEAGRHARSHQSTSSVRRRRRLMSI